MKLNFDKENDAQLKTGTFESMMNVRKQSLPDIEKNIQKILRDYGGENICILIQKEDENGNPKGHKLLMAGAAPLAASLDMVSRLTQTRDKLMEDIIDSAKGNRDALLQITEYISKNLIGKEK